MKLEIERKMLLEEKDIQNIIAEHFHVDKDAVNINIDVYQSDYFQEPHTTLRATIKVGKEVI